jgi:hypothetical protein
MVKLLCTHSLCACKATILTPGLLDAKTLLLEELLEYDRFNLGVYNDVREGMRRVTHVIICFKGNPGLLMQAQQERTFS